MVNKTRKAARPKVALSEPATPNATTPEPAVSQVASFEEAAEMATSQSVASEADSPQVVSPIDESQPSAEAPRTDFSKVIDDIYQQVFGRDADPTGLEHRQNQLAQGITPETIRGELVDSDEADKAIKKLYLDLTKEEVTEDVLTGEGAITTQGNLTIHKDELRAGKPWSEIRRDLAYSLKVAALIQAIYPERYCRGVNGDEWTCHRDTLATGKSLDELRICFADTVEAENKIKAFCSKKWGIELDAVGDKWRVYQDVFRELDVSLSDIERRIAESHEALDHIKAACKQWSLQDPDPKDLSKYMSILAREGIGFETIRSMIAVNYQFGPVKTAPADSVSVLAAKREVAHLNPKPNNPNSDFMRQQRILGAYLNQDS